MEASAAIARLTPKPAPDSTCVRGVKFDPNMPCGPPCTTRIVGTFPLLGAPPAGAMTQPWIGVPSKLSYSSSVGAMRE